MIQPAGALSAQVPAVGVREQNVNSAGRIRVALPKTGVGVNGSVSVSNLPVNSAGRVQTQNGTGQPLQFNGSQSVGTNPVTMLQVAGAGVFQGIMVTEDSGAVPNVIVTIDGRVAFNRSTAGSGCCWINSPEWGSALTPAGFNSMYFTPNPGFSFHKSLTITVSNTNNKTGNFTWRGWYTQQS
ncbi:MAG: hypothetical protein ACYCS7_09265 [Acidimicrobiales bacterium]